MKLTVIIPTLNEAEGIGPTINEILSTLPNSHIVVIDANSTDKTPLIARGLGATVIEQKGRGKGRAMAQILEYLRHSNPESPKYLIITDADYTYPCDQLPRMIEILEENPLVGMVTGKRIQVIKIFRLTKALINWYVLGNYLLRTAHKFCNKVGMHDPLTGLRVIRFKVIKDWRPQAKSFDIEVELNHHITKKKYKIVEVPINYRPRLGRKKLGLRHGFTILKRILIMMFNDYYTNKESLTILPQQNRSAK
jgi:dolichol-phosphate mannosyltransferase